ncbi:GNAT family N-acetyltransferase [Cognatiyoonia sp. IB215182]|uniref:GNAT family N-acetyltransferase n=1 Tax=Cognatiyoonia sp. IB215182 TaxID=3097353 RepID=UPI002A0DF282|nr:GNAT family N-acetyltransferase [Cognatiyoonia sp. IB215182]MDX8351639.1 GNAT family N-acetyltransferase [Cognatiyoonia sp. IB215182]
MRPWLTPPTGEAAALSMRFAELAPVVQTERLTLRLPRISDWDVLEPIWTTERAVHIGGPMSAEDAWLDFNQLVAGWVLRGHGALTICDKAGAVLGLVLLGHEFGDPQPELGWLLTEEAEGRGFATEAAKALLPMCRAVYGDGFASYITDGNDASVRVATKLGARKTGTHPLGAHVAVYHYKDEGAAQ